MARRALMTAPRRLLVAQVLAGLITLLAPGVALAAPMDDRCMGQTDCCAGGYYCPPEVVVAFRN